MLVLIVLMVMVLVPMVVLIVLMLVVVALMLVVVVLMLVVVVLMVVLIALMVVVLVLMLMHVQGHQAGTLWDSLHRAGQSWPVRYLAGRTRGLGYLPRAVQLPQREGWFADAVMHLWTLVLQTLILNMARGYSATIARASAIFPANAHSLDGPSNQGHNKDGLYSPR